MSGRAEGKGERGRGFPMNGAGHLPLQPTCLETMSSWRPQPSRPQLLSQRPSPLEGQLLSWGCMPRGAPCRVLPRVGANAAARLQALRGLSQSHVWK